MPAERDLASDAGVARAVSALERGVARSVDWRAWVARRPGTALALAFGLGILLGRRKQ